MISTLTLSASGDMTKKTLEGYYGVKIKYNNQFLTSQDQPFIVNGRTYVPLRMLMETFTDKDIQWDSSNNQVLIYSKFSAMEAIYTQQILERNKQISDLNKTVSSLKYKISLLEDELINASVDLDDLEDDLTNDYEDYENLNLSITLKGDINDIELTVKLDENDWKDLSTNKKEDLLQDICDDIWNEDGLEEADVEGFIKDGRRKLEEFTVKADGNVELLDFDDLLEEFEEDLEQKYEDDWDDENLPLKLYLSGDEDDVDFEIRFSLRTYDDEWDDLSDYELKRLMDDIYDDLRDEYEDADVIGYIYDTHNDENVAEYDGSDLTRDN
jgi:hypothetical protein